MKRHQAICQKTYGEPSWMENIKMKRRDVITHSNDSDGYAIEIEIFKVFCASPAVCHDHERNVGGLNSESPCFFKAGSMLRARVSENHSDLFAYVENKKRMRIGKVLR